MNLAKISRILQRVTNLRPARRLALPSRPENVDMLRLTLTMSPNRYVFGKQDFGAALVPRPSPHHKAESRVAVLRVYCDAHTRTIADLKRLSLSGQSKGTQKHSQGRRLHG